MVSLKDITGSAKTIIDIANDLKNIELKEAILDLKEKVLELREENISLKDKLSEKQKYNMKFIDNYYWNIGQNGEKEGPYCSACWDGDGKAVRMNGGNGYVPHFCPVCNIKIRAKNK